MSAAELKNSLVRRIQKIDDPVVLESILKIVLSEEEANREIDQWLEE